jgi:PUA domain protein
MVKIKNKHQLKRKEIRGFLEQIHEKLDDTYPFSVDTVEIGTVDTYELIFINDIPLFFKRNDEFFYTLVGLLKYQPRKRYVVVDGGAVRFVTNGADVMAPGIVDADETIQKEDTVWICNEQHRKPLAVGKALMTGVEMKAASSGKAVEMIHYIGDDLWNKTKELM